MRAAAVLLLGLAACGGAGVTGPSDSGNEAFLQGRVRELEGKLAMGRFDLFFAEPPAPGVAGWALCGTGHAPWKVGMNAAFVAASSDRADLEMKLAHEMCHHAVDQRGGSCRDEWAAELCAFDLVNR